VLLEINEDYVFCKEKIIHKCEKHFKASGAKFSLIIVGVKMFSRLRKLRQDVSLVKMSRIVVVMSWFALFA